MPAKKKQPEITRRRFFGFLGRLGLAGGTVGLGVGGRKYYLRRKRLTAEAANAAAKRAKIEDFRKRYENATILEPSKSVRHLEKVKVMELNEKTKVTFIVRGKKEKTIPVLKLPKWIHTAIEEEATKKGYRPNFIKCIVCFESSGDPYVVSSAGAKGIGQLKDEAAKEAGIKPGDLHNVRENVKAVCGYLDLQRKGLSGRKLKFVKEEKKYQELPEEIQLALALSAFRWGMGNLSKELKAKGSVEGALNRRDYVRDVIANSWHMDGRKLETEFMSGHQTVLITEDVLIRNR
ncbi:MAG: lytic transglycosylase domain-containing protein [Candidatus Diapherotrites archaeon]